MELRNLGKLISLEISNEFLLKNNLKVHFFKEGDIAFYNECNIIHTYGYYIEDIPYIDIYKIDEENILSLNVDSLISKLNLGSQTINTYKKVKEEYTQPITWDQISNEKNCLKTEQNYLTYIYVLNNYVKSVFNCKNSIEFKSFYEMMSIEFERKYEHLVERLKS